MKPNLMQKIRDFAIEYQRQTKVLKVLKGKGTFKAYYSACKWAKDNGWAMGSMCRDNPIAMMREPFGYISKWDNLSIVDDVPQVQAVMIGTDFRDGTEVAIVELSNLNVKA